MKVLYSMSEDHSTITPAVINAQVGMKAYKYQSIEELSRIEDVWKDFMKSPRGDYDLYLNEIQSKEEIISPFVVLITDQDIPQALMVSMIEKKPLAFALSYKSIKGPTLRVLRIVFLEIVGDQQERCARCLVSQLISCLQRKEADIINIENIALDSVFYKTAITKPGFFAHDFSPVIETHWEFFLPESLNDVYKILSSKQKHELFRKERKFHKKYAENVEFKSFHRIEDIAKICHYSEKVARKSVKRPLNYGFKIKNESVGFLTLAAQKGWLRTYFLFVNDNPCTFCIGLVYNEILYFYYADYDPAYQDCSPGIVLIKYILESIFTEKETIKAIDWGTGDISFKKYLSNHSTRVASFYVYPGNLYGTLLNVGKVCLVAIQSLGRAIIKKLGLRHYIAHARKNHILSKYLKNEGLY